MRFRFIWVGKTRNAHWLALEQEYFKRLSHFVRCEIDVARDAPPGPARVETEGNRILDKVNPSSLVCLLDVAGDPLSSQGLAEKVEKWQNDALRDVTFVIGGAEGVSSQVAARADHRLSLSFLTLTHEMARVVLLEQLYRAFTIIKGFPYQK